MFHGPVDQALPFFQSHLGFECPVRKDAASFLQEVTTPKGEQNCCMHGPAGNGMLIEVNLIHNTACTLNCLGLAVQGS